MTTNDRTETTATTNVDVTAVLTDVGRLLDLAATRLFQQSREDGGATPAGIVAARVRLVADDVAELLPAGTDSFSLERAGSPRELLRAAGERLADVPPERLTPDTGSLVLTIADLYRSVPAGPARMTCPNPTCNKNNNL